VPGAAKGFHGVSALLLFLESRPVVKRGLLEFARRQRPTDPFPVFSLFFEDPLFEKHANTPVSPDNLRAWVRFPV
jgi:hypothetical protein